ncbi:hypothetical protein E2P81_ATG11596 [Venturia nashicola]|uniref:Uncharacterized protein n=1 Tax=Venturia nashicola TaxID=86259 RepID=A0A4Z1P1A5_9PEZI|nr:hypothetical protein E6O75_ATG11289 [Venturia nashicola]TLD18686.1 hypothetical protein E2P81_ATG11596 [Venturia nashicola]
MRNLGFMSQRISEASEKQLSTKDLYYHTIPQFAKQPATTHHAHARKNALNCYHLLFNMTNTKAMSLTAPFKRGDGNT